MSATPWAIGSTEYAQERASGFWRWRDCGVPPQANRRSQAILERLGAIREAEAGSQSEWTRVKVVSVRPDGLPVMVMGRVGWQEARRWQSSHRQLVAERYEAMRRLSSLTPVEPPVRQMKREMTWTQMDGDSVGGVHAWQLAAWRRRYLCDVKAPGAV